MKIRGLRRAAAVAVVTLVIPSQAAAQANGGAAPRSGAGAAADSTSASSGAVVIRPVDVVAQAGTDGFGLRSADGAFSLRLGGVAQYDGRAFLGDDEDRSVDGFDVRRVRADVRGTVYSDYDFRVYLDYAGNRVEVLDAYLEGRFSPLLQIRAGKFKPPVGLERLQSVSVVTFPERGFPTALVPSRDIGVQVQGGLGGSALTYAVGLFNGAGDGATGDSDLSDSKDVAGRLFFQPFAGGPAALRGLGFGIAGTVGEQRATPASPSLPSFRTTTGRSTFLRFRSDGTEEGTVVLEGRRTRVAPQAYWYLGPVGLLTEYVRSTSNVRIGEESARLRASAWQVAGSWVLTGEAPSYRGVNPARPFEPGSGNPGAIELAGRIQGIEADGDIFPVFANPAGAATEATAYTLGLNWYLNRVVRLQAAWEHTRFTGAEPGADVPDEDVLITRFQVAF